MSGDTYDWTSQMHPGALAAAMGAYTCGPTFTHTLVPSRSTEASVYIFKDEANQLQAVKVPHNPTPTGFEGQAAKNFDGIEPEALTEQILRDALVRLAAHVQGQQVTNAISALHRAHKSDGRPHHYLLEGE